MTENTAPTTGELLDALARIDEIADEIAIDESMTPEEYAEVCRRIETHEALRDALRLCITSTNALGYERPEKYARRRLDHISETARAALALLEP